MLEQPPAHTGYSSSSGLSEEALPCPVTISGYLHKLGGGKSEGNHWKRRHFSLHGTALQYYRSEPGASPLQRPNGAVLVDSCQVAAREECAAADGSLRWGFSVFSMVTGDTFLLAAEAEAERARWMAALQGQPLGRHAAAATATAWCSDEVAAVEEADARRGEAAVALHAEEVALCKARATVQAAQAAQQRAEAQLRQARVSAAGGNCALVKPATKALGRSCAAAEAWKPAGPTVATTLRGSSSCASRCSTGGTLPPSPNSTASASFSTATDSTHVPRHHHHLLPILPPQYLLTQPNPPQRPALGTTRCAPPSSTWSMPYMLPRWQPRLWLRMTYRTTRRTSPTTRIALPKTNRHLARRPTGI